MRKRLIVDCLQSPCTSARGAQAEWTISATRSSGLQAGIDILGHIPLLELSQCQSNSNGLLVNPDDSSEWGPRSASQIAPVAPH